MEKQQKTISNKGEQTVIKPRGRHDVCVVQRAVPIVEAMVALAIANNQIISKVSKLQLSAVKEY